MPTKHDVFEFPEDHRIVQTNLDDYATEVFENQKTIPKEMGTTGGPPRNKPFRASLFFVLSVALSMVFATFFTRFSTCLGSALSFVTVMILREWNRVFGNQLTPHQKCFMRYMPILREHKEYIPCYNMEWLFGSKYQPYYYGCTGPQLNPDMDRTPDDPESRSPVKKRSNEKLKKGD
ncbi:unnamed protein product [Caenorhabditis sp. 36 PRJEB53466]|nr:unnamed protein product [Caenorhabditis sp. 36 PRJEB53466]